MIFLRPEFLYGLFALSIPLIIHLFNFRRHKKLYFSDISRLKTIATHTRKEQKLKHLIVLLLRMLAILFIVIAISGPELKKDDLAASSTSQTVALYIDNSFSMMAEGQSGRLFESARQYALQVIEGASENTNFIILSNSNTGQLNRVLGQEAAISELEKMEISYNSKKLSQVIGSQNRILENSEIHNSTIYLFSDFQAYTSDITSLPEDTVNRYLIIPFTHIQSKNIYIDSCQIYSPDVMKEKVIGLSVWIKNDSDTDYEKVPLKLSINGHQKAVAGIDLKAGTSKQVDLNFTVSESGWHYGLIEIEDFPITFDDHMYFAFDVKQNIEVLIIGPKGSNRYLNNFYSSDDIFKITEMNYRSIDFGKFKNFDLVILAGIPNISTGLTSNVKQYITEGGNLLFIPPNQESHEDISVFLKEMNAGNIIRFDTSETRVSRLKLSNDLFSESITKVPQNADLPTIKQHYHYNFPISSGVETLVSLLSGNDFLSKKNIGSGQLYLLSVGLDDSYGNFASHLLFVPIMHGVASKGSSVKKLFYTLGKDQNITLNIDNSIVSESPFYLSSPQTQPYIIPGQKYKNGKLILSLDELTLQDGYYNLMMSDSVVSVIAFNFNRDESEMSFLNSEELEDMFEESGLQNFTILNTSDPNYSEIVNALQKESDFWKLFIIFALSVIFIEILILRFWK